MPIETLYGVSCDECDECLFRREMHAWPSESDATDAAKSEGWMVADEFGERVLCPSCAEEIEGPSATNSTEE